MDLIVVARFMSNVHHEPNSGCWLWGGALFGDGGYGAFWVDGQTLGAHRISWVIHRGRMPRGMQVCHHCDNRSCVNPAHLFLGSVGDNARDRSRKGRGRDARGVRSGLAKLSDEAVRSLRQRVASGESQASICREMSLSAACISMAVTGKRWKHVA